MPADVDGSSNPTEIAQIFKEQFTVEPLLRPVSECHTEACNVEKPMGITSKQVTAAIRNTKRGKSPGHDCLSIEHLQYAGKHVSRVLSLFFTLCLRHSYMPKGMLKAIVVRLLRMHRVI